MRIIINHKFLLIVRDFHASAIETCRKKKEERNRRKREKEKEEKMRSLTLSFPM